MAASTTVNGRTVVHRKSGGALATFPDVCLTPTPGGPVPVPYPNLARSADLEGGASTVTVDGVPVAVLSSVFGRSTGDEPGTQKGVVSRAQGGEARFLNGSFDVQIEGEAVVRLLDPMASNGGSPTNTPPAAEVQPPLAVPPGRGPDDDYGHVVDFTFTHAHPDAAVGEGPPDFLDLEAAVRLSGPENETWAPSTTYPGGVVNVWEDGDYTLRFLDFDLEPRPLLPGSVVEQALRRLRREAERRLRNAKHTAENALEDLGEVADRLEADLRTTGADLSDAARREIAEARARLAQARADASEAVGHLDRAIDAVEGGGWREAAGRARDAARQAGRAAREAADAVRGLGRAPGDLAGRAQENLRRTLARAAQGLEDAAGDVQNALGLGD